MPSSCRFWPAVSEASPIEDILDGKDPRMAVILFSKTNAHHHLPPLSLMQTCCEVHEHPLSTHFSISTYLICQRGLYPLFSVPLLTLPFSVTHCSLVSVPLTPQASVTRGLPIAKFSASLPTQHHFGEAFYTLHNSLLETHFSFGFHTSAAPPHPPHVLLLPLSSLHRPSLLCLSLNL